MYVTITQALHKI